MKASRVIAWFKGQWLWGTADRGDRGEQLAAKFLARQPGWRIVTRNWRSPQDRRDELDLIAHDGEILVFVEVKTRSINARVPGYYAVNARKKRVVKRAARAYLARLPVTPATFRFDIVEIALPRKGDARPAVIRHFANIPLFPRHFQGGC